MVNDNVQLDISIVWRGQYHNKNRDSERVHFEHLNKFSEIHEKYVELTNLDDDYEPKKEENYRPWLTDHVSKSAALITKVPPIIVHILTRSLNKINANKLPYKGCKQEISPAVVADK